LLIPALKPTHPAPVATVNERFTDVRKSLDRHRDASQPGGYALYSTLSRAEVRSLAQQVDALAEAESQVAGAIVG
jgi:iron uptake system component EfeO